MTLSQDFCGLPGDAAGDLDNVTMSHNFYVRVYQVMRQVILIKWQCHKISVYTRWRRRGRCLDKVTMSQDFCACPGDAASDLFPPVPHWTPLPRGRLLHHGGSHLWGTVHCQKGNEVQRGCRCITRNTRSLRYYTKIGNAWTISCCITNYFV